MEGQMIIAMNKHREICALVMNGTHLLHKDQVHSVSASPILSYCTLCAVSLIHWFSYDIASCNITVVL